MDLHCAKPAARQTCLDEAPLSACNLIFKSPELERDYKTHHKEAQRQHDQQAVAAYLAMVAFGSGLYLFIVCFVPDMRGKRVYESCSSLIALSWLGPALHLALLAALPKQVYTTHRTAITLGFRLLYLYGTAVNGYGQCAVGRLGTDEIESVFSALVWRGGLIGLLWYAGAFPLLFWQHCLVQAAFLAAYWAALGPAVCADLARVPHGYAAITAVTWTARTLWAQLLAAAAVPGAAARAAAAAAGTAAESTSILFDSNVLCLRDLRWFQFAVGHVLPSFVIYCVETRSRMQWWRLQQRKLARQLRRPAVAAGSCSGGRPSSDSGSSSGGSEGSRPSSNSSSYCSLCGLLLPASGCQQMEAAAEAAARPQLTPASAPPSSCPTAASSKQQKQQQQQQQQQQVCRCSDSAAGTEADVAALTQPDSFNMYCQEADLPPTSREVYVAVLALCLVWLGLGAAEGHMGSSRAAAVGRSTARLHQ